MEKGFQFLPVSRDEMIERGWYYYDFLVVTADAYVDHPSFGHAIISRILEKAGYRVAMLCLPPWQDESAFKQFGRHKQIAHFLLPAHQPPNKSNPLKKRPILPKAEDPLLSRAKSS